MLHTKACFLSLAAVVLAPAARAALATSCFRMVNGAVTSGAGTPCGIVTSDSVCQIFEVSRHKADSDRSSPLYRAAMLGISVCQTVSARLQMKRPLAFLVVSEESERQKLVAHLTLSTDYTGGCTDLNYQSPACNPYCSMPSSLSFVLEGYI
jgi:hypothetical protein